MHDFVSYWGITLGALVSALLLGWAAVVNTGGSWPVMLSTAALGTLLVTSTTVLSTGGRTRPPALSLAHVIRDARAEPLADPSVAGKRKATR